MMVAMPPAPAKVMFVGKLVAERDRPRWVATARALGVAAAEQGVHLVLSSDAHDTLERGVIDGAARFTRMVGRPLAWETHEPADGRIRWRPLPADLAPPLRHRTYGQGKRRWENAHVGALDSADAVIAMGGHENTRSVCRAAIERRVPCVPIPFFGGAAKDLFAALQAPATELLAAERNVLDSVGRRWSSLPTAARELITKLAALVGLARRRPVYFISYSRKDNSQADHAEVILRRAGRGVLRDEARFVPGKLLPDEIKLAIGAADHFLVVDSSDAALSHWVPQEISIAEQLNRAGKRPARLVGLLLEGHPPRTSLNPNGVHVDGRTRAERNLGIKQLIDTESHFKR